MIKGKIHSIQSLGTLDGPGVRFVLFLQGCNLRCGCCHNPDTWSLDGGKELTSEEIIDRAIRYKEYFGNAGGVTVSGGEPLLQAEFVYEFFVMCHRNGINTCLDTSGSIMNENVKRLLSVTDRVLLDIKFTNDEMYRLYAGCGISAPLDFLSYLNKMHISTTIRQVVIPTLNDNKENISLLNRIVENNKCVDRIDLLPFKKICKTKYENMNIPFRFDSIMEPSSEVMNSLESLLIL